MTLQIGDEIIDFNLKNVDGNNYSLKNFQNKELLAVIFSCNHCPYVIASEREMVQIQKDYADKKVQLIAINPNDEVNYPQDSYENMISRAKEKGFNFPYLRDETQEVAKAYGASRTPEFYIFNKERRLVYHGRLNENPKDTASVNIHDVRTALDEILSGKEVSTPQTQALGCSIKWKEE
jgi:peroxiredoxin